MRAFDRFVQAYHTHLCRDPNERLYLGLSDDLGSLPDPSMSMFDSVIDEARELLAELASIDSSALGFDERLDVDLARLTLEREVHDHTLTFNGRRNAVQCPCAGDDIGDGLFLLFANDPRSASDRLEDIAQRLEKVPSYLGAMLARLDTPVARWVDIECAKLDGLPGLFETLEGWAVKEGWSDLKRFSMARVEAEESLVKYRMALTGLSTTTNLHVGDATARRVVYLRGINKSLEELHAHAVAFLARNRGTLEDLRGRLVVKYGLPQRTSVTELQGFLNEEYAVKITDGRLEDVLDIYQAERRKILDFIERRNLFDILEDQDMKIIRTPPFMMPSIPAGAMMSPPPFRDGPKISMVYLTLSQELLAEHNLLGIPGMMIHEGIPGHHLQLANAAKHPSVIRRHFEAMDHCEGWTTMLEDYMLDLGYMGELTDEARFIGKLDINRLGARVAIDLFFMTGDRRYLKVSDDDVDSSSDDPFQAAGALLQAVTGFTPERTQAELNWYSQERGYPLSYLTGNILVWELKRELAACQLGEKEGLVLDRAFHRLYLESGSMPVSFLRRVAVQEGLLH